MKSKNFIIFITIFICLFVGVYKRINKNSQEFIFYQDLEQVNTKDYKLNEFFVINNREIYEENGNTYIDKYLNNIQNKNILININTAPEDILINLPSIGKSIAKNIIEYRQKNGSFKNIYEIKNVKGIGNKIYEKIKDFIAVGGEYDL